MDNQKDRNFLPGMSSTSRKSGGDVNSTSARILAPDDAVQFTYPEGFNNVAHSLQFLPDDDTRKQTLTGLVIGMLMQ